ncbi:unnamed protein product [Ectocarpus fasciculatus]
MRLLFSLLSLTFSLCLSAQEVKQEKVYITKTGEKHHTKNCHYLKYSKIETTLEEADKGEYTPCNVCRLNTSISSSEKSPKGKTKAISKRWALPGQHTKRNPMQTQCSLW